MESRFCRFCSSNWIKTSRQPRRLLQDLEFSPLFCAFQPHNYQYWFLTVPQFWGQLIFVKLVKCRNNHSKLQVESRKSYMYSHKLLVVLCMHMTNLTNANLTYLNDIFSKLSISTFNSTRAFLQRINVVSFLLIACNDSFRLLWQYWL